MKDIYNTLPTERFDILKDNYQEFLSRVNDPTKEPYKVYAPLPPNALADLELIREVSRSLQNKKDEDVKKAAVQKAADEAEAAEKAQEAAKEEPETTKEN